MQVLTTKEIQLIGWDTVRFSYIPEQDWDNFEFVIKSAPVGAVVTVYAQVNFEASDSYYWDYTTQESMLIAGSIAAVLETDTINFYVINASAIPGPLKILLRAEMYATADVENVVDDSVDIIVGDTDTQTSQISQGVNNIYNNITINTDNILGDVKKYMGDASFDISSSVNTLSSDVKGSINDSANKVSGSVTGLAGKIEAGLKKVSDGIASFIGNKLSEVKTIIGYVRDKIQDGLKSITGEITKISEIAWGTFLSKISGAISGLTDSFWKKFIDTFFERK